CANQTMRLLIPPRSFRSPTERMSAPAGTNVIHWLPFLWRRVLFPGQAETSSRIRVASLLGLIAVASLIIFPSLNFHLFEPDEGRYAQIPKEMLDRNDWLTPILQGEPYLDKPPLFYWLVMVGYGAFGP